MTLMLIGIAGGLGAMARYLIDKNLFTNSAFPFSTFLINCLGSFLIGVVYVLFLEKNLITKEMSVYLSVGFLGGFTTFSAYALQTLVLGKEAGLSQAAVYFVGTPVATLICVFAGLSLARVMI
jgi:fluoride exporter